MSRQKKLKFYKPSEIAKMGLIRNSRNSDSWVQNYQFILNEIKAGRLKARHYGQSDRFYRVSESEIKRYLKG